MIRAYRMEKRNTVKPSLLIIVGSFLLGMILEIMPLPHWAIWARPEWVFIILLFWVVSQPQYVGLCIAFCMGILMDMLTGTVLGQHAFIFTFMIYLITIFLPHFKSFLLWQQLSIVFVLLLLQLVLQYWIFTMTGTSVQNIYYWLPALSSMLLWIWFYILLKDRSEVVRGFG